MSEHAPPPATRARVNVSMDVPNLDRGLAFYADVFGFAERARPFPTMAVVDANNVMLCMHEKAAGTAPSPDGSDRRRYDRHWTPVHLDLHVADFDATLRRIVALGGRIENEFRTGAPMPTAFCCDPFGNGFCVMGERSK